MINFKSTDILCQDIRKYIQYIRKIEVLIYS